MNHFIFLVFFFLSILSVHAKKDFSSASKKDFSLNTRKELKSPEQIRKVVETLLNNGQFMNLLTFLDEVESTFGI
jgi:hypothetical protein